MSTYLVGLVISDFLCRPTYYNSKLSNQTIAIDICVRSNAIDQTDLAFDSSVPLLEFFEDNFQIQYFMPKLGKKLNENQSLFNINNIFNLDHIGVRDFDAGGKLFYISSIVL